MSVEARRGCGFRKIGGLYLVAPGLGAPCCKLPLPLTVCPTCSAGIKQSRGWTWVDPVPLFASLPCTPAAHACPLAAPHTMGRAGLLWVGAGFYSTVAAFDAEAARLGISRRIAAVPRGFMLGETFVLLAHPAAIVRADAEPAPGIFRVFRPTAIEKLLPESARDSKEEARLRAAGVTPVFVPDDDADHQGSVYDDEPELPLEAAS